MRYDVVNMEGLGNTFVILIGPYSPTTEEIINFCSQYGDKPADGLLVVTPIDNKTVGMKYWNTDGSPAEMCGNGLRCLAKFSRTKGLVDSDDFVVETDAGPLSVHIEDDVGMVEAQIGKATVADASVEIQGEQFFEANIGNPHAITFVEDVDSVPVTKLGPKVETDDHFPNRTNVEFVQIIAPNQIKLRTWERGAGETLACGTAMAAASAALVKHKNGMYPVVVEVLGGKAKLWLDQDGYTRMLGSADFS